MEPITFDYNDLVWALDVWHADAFENPESYATPLEVAEDYLNHRDHGENPVFGRRTADMLRSLIEERRAQGD